MSESYRVSFFTLGCKVNQYETNSIKAKLKNYGFKCVDIDEAADVVVVNTCSVTSIADSKSRTAIRKAAKLNPNVLIAVTGCYSQLEPTEVEEIDGVWLVIPNEEKDKLPEIIAAKFGMQTDIDSHISLPISTSRTRAFVKVQDGCDQFCAYCVIPFARSNKYSRNIEEVISEVEAMANAKYKEVVLTGIRLGSYEYNLPELISRCAEISKIERIRLSSIEPWEVNDALLDAMQNPKVCRHLHIPLQSGDDFLISQMNRPYTTSQYAEIIKKVRERINDIGISTDVIVGFPGETEFNFNNTKAFIKEMDFSRLHIFRYSQRKRTAAAEMLNQVSPEIKKQRADDLIKFGKRRLRDFACRHIGKIMPVLAETQVKDTKMMTGYTDNYIQVHFPAHLYLTNKIVNVKIESVESDGTAFGDYSYLITKTKIFNAKLRNSEIANILIYNSPT